MRATFFLDTLSHWCLVAVPAVRELETLGVRTEIVIAPVNDGKPMGVTNAFEAWCYERGTHAYAKTFDASWCEGPQSSTGPADIATLVAIDAGAKPLEAFEAIASEALERGALFARPDVVNAFAARLVHLDVAEFTRRAEDPAIARRLADGNARLVALGADERPTFLLENANGDRAILKGMWQRDAVVACAKALLADERAYANAGTPPAI